MSQLNLNKTYGTKHKAPIGGCRSNPPIKTKKEIRDIIRGNCLSEYSDLMDYLDAEGIWERIEVAENNTIHFDALLRSIRHKKG